MVGNHFRYSATGWEYPSGTSLASWTPPVVSVVASRAFAMSWALGMSRVHPFISDEVTKSVRHDAWTCPVSVERDRAWVGIQLSCHTLPSWSVQLRYFNQPSWGSPSILPVNRARPTAFQSTWGSGMTSRARQYG